MCSNFLFRFFRPSQSKKARPRGCHLFQRLTTAPDQTREARAGWRLTACGVHHMLQRRRGPGPLQHSNRSRGHSHETLVFHCARRARSMDKQHSKGSIEIGRWVEEGGLAQAPPPILARFRSNPTFCAPSGMRSRNTSAFLVWDRPSQASLTAAPSGCPDNGEVSSAGGGRAPMGLSRTSTGSHAPLLFLLQRWVRACLSGARGCVVRTEARAGVPLSATRGRAVGRAGSRESGVSLPRADATHEVWRLQPRGLQQKAGFLTSLKRTVRGCEITGGRWAPGSGCGCGRVPAKGPGCLKGA